MNKTGLTEDRICTVLKEKLYSMADCESTNDNRHPKLKWIHPINSPEGMISILENAVYLLGYVQEYKCGREDIDRIIQNEVYPVVCGLRDEFDFVLACVILVMCKEEINFTDEKEVQSYEVKILRRFVEILEWAHDHYDSFTDNSENQESVSKGVSDEYMDTSGLGIGMVVKNYKEMCKILKEEICGGDSKKAQLKEWTRYFSWEKKGQKFIILDIYDTPLSKEDGRQNKNIYVQYIGVILIKILAKQKNDRTPFYITTNQMWKLLGMINNNYKNISLDDLNDRIIDYNITSFDMKKFYQRCNQRLRDILFSSLNRLEDRALIKYEIETVIVFNDGGETIFLPADDQQKKQILKAERIALKDMGLESKQHAYAKFKETEFFERVNAYLQEWYGWDYTFNRIKINYNKSDVLETVYKDEMKLRNDFEEIKLQRLGLNDRIIEALYKNAQTMAENRHRKAEQEYQEAVEKYKNEYMVIGDIPESFLPTKSDLRIFDYLPYFVEIQNRLTDELISIRKPQDRKTFIEFNNDDVKELDELFKN